MKKLCKGVAQFAQHRPLLSLRVNLKLRSNSMMTTQLMVGI